MSAHDVDGAAIGLASSLRAFVWLRWRLLINSIQGGQKRDRLEQISRAFALFVPVILVLLSMGSVVGLAIVGFFGGRAIARARVDAEMIVWIVRMTLFGGLVLLVLITVVLPHQTSAARYTRLILLPIRRQTLHLIEVLASLSDPVVAFIVPALLTFALALALFGRAGAAVWALAATVGLLAVFTSLTALLGFLVAWLLRSRRRGELFTLVFVLGFSLVSFLPAFFGERLENRYRGRPSGEARRSFSVENFDRRLPVWTRGLPSELYGRALLEGLAGNGAGAGLAVMLLVLEGGVLYAASSRVHRQLLTALEGDRTRRRTAGRQSQFGRLPLIGAEASAVAWAQVRTSLRSVRGRLLVLLPGPMMAMMTLLLRQMGSDDRFAVLLASNGHLTVGVGGLFCLYALQALTMNMFGSDRAGLTLQFLSPIADVDLARGKVAGCGMVLGVGLAFAIVPAVLVAANSPPALWLAVILGVIATYVLLSPIFVWLSAIFPVASDLSKTGSGGNPHPLPMFVGMIFVLFCALPAASIIVAAQFWLETPIVAPILMVGWLLVAALIAWPFIGVAARAIGLRRENLALVAQGK
ncbi:MAG TPA: hypothetical protein VH679_03970 [Vicinamibacterales bacterium]